MKALAEWSGLTLYLGIGVILGCVIMLAGNFDITMVVGGLVCVISVGIYTFVMWRTKRLFRHKDV